MSEVIQTFGARVLFPALWGSGSLVMKADHERVVAELEQQLETLRKGPVVAPEGFVLVQIDALQELSNNYLDVAFTRYSEKQAWEKPVQESIAVAKEKKEKTE